MKRIVASLIALAFGTTLLSAPMVALSVPGNTCNPEAGHGTSGCHKVTTPPPVVTPPVVTPPVVAVPTSPTVTQIAGPSSAKVRRALKLSGTLSPVTTPSTVTIIKSRLVGKKWKSAGTATVSVVDGKYGYSFKPTKKGKWRFVANYYGGVDGPITYDASTSSVKYVKVR